MIDYHCHLLPALDDGPTTLDEALLMARALADFGFREVHCTPHCLSGQFEFSPVEVRAAVDRLQAALDSAAIPLRLHPGMEYCLDAGFERFAANLLPLGESRLVLCEAPPRALPAALAGLLELIVVQGFTPLIAHPERSEAVWQLLEQQWRDQGEEQSTGHRATPLAPAAPFADRRYPFWRRWFTARPAGALADDDRSVSTSRQQAATLPPPPVELPEACLYQANLGSFAGCYGERVQRRAYELLQRNGYHCFASDLHEARAIPACLEATRDKLQFNPALQRLANFVAPPRSNGSNTQLAFW
jgi:protein-tyrosine phosphatase